MSLETLFWSLAIVGTAVFILRSALSFLGLGLGHEADAFHHVDAMGTEGSFQVLSFTSLSAFTTVFGWAGLAALKEFGLSSPYAILVAALIGFLVMLGVAYLFHGLVKLETKGQGYDIHETIGKSGTTYERIPAGGTGIVQISFSGMLREVKARAEDLQEISTGTSVVVLSTLDRETLVVRKL